MIKLKRTLLNLTTLQLACWLAALLLATSAAYARVSLAQDGEVDVIVECGDVEGLVLAIHDANARRPTSTRITLGPPSTTGEPCRYEFHTPAMNNFWGPTALPQTVAPITIRSAPGHENAELDGMGKMRLILTGGALTLESVTIMNGRADQNLGGGIINEGHLTLDGNTTIIQNSSITDGGGIFNLMTVVMNDESAIIGNHSDGDGGGIYNCGTVILNGNSFITQNVAQRLGGLAHWGNAVVLNDNALIFDNTPDDCNC